MNPARSSSRCAHKKLHSESLTRSAPARRWAGMNTTRTSSSAASDSPGPAAPSLWRVREPCPGWSPGQAHVRASAAGIGCGLGASTILLARAYPSSAFTGSGYHSRSIEIACKRAGDAGAADRVVSRSPPRRIIPAPGTTRPRRRQSAGSLRLGHPFWRGGSNSGKMAGGGCAAVAAGGVRSDRTG